MNLTLREGQYVDIAKGAYTIVMDHFNEVILLILIVVHQTGTHIYEIYLSPLEAGNQRLHMQILE